jgi:hypothetical protein
MEELKQPSFWQGLRFDLGNGSKASFPVFFAYLSQKVIANGTDRQR